MTETSPLDLRQYISLQDRLFAELGQQFRDGLAGIVSEVRGLADQTRDVGERLARIEGMQVGSVQEIKDLKEDTKGLRLDLRSTQEENVRLSSRIIRVETMLLPITAIGAAVLSGLVAWVVGTLTHTLPH